MASSIAPTGTTERFDQLCEAIAREQGGADASLKAAHVVRRSNGAYSLVGLEAGGERVVYHYEGVFASAMPFDEEGVHREAAETLARNEDVREGLDRVAYSWVHPEYRGDLDAE
jgi:imidazolonepropionase-like amidohydrolase